MTDSQDDIIIMSFTALCVLLLIGKTIRANVRFVQLLFLPASVVAGFLGLFSLQVMNYRYPDLHDYMMKSWFCGWDVLPEFLINIIFASLFLGHHVPTIPTVWRKASTQLAYGQILAFGQYGVAILTCGILTKFFTIDDMFGTTIPIGFEGGHGTAAGVGSTYRDLGWKEGKDFALASATVGILCAIVLGFSFIKLAVKLGYVHTAQKHDSVSLKGVYPIHDRPSAGVQTVASNSIEALSLHVAVVGLAILIAFGLKKGMVAIENTSDTLKEQEVLSSFPIFPLAMLGGILIQSLSQKFAKTPLIDSGLIDRISGLSLDFLLVAAITTMRLDAVAKGLIPFFCIVVAVLSWHMLCLWVLAPRLLPNHWFCRAIGEFGQSCGVSASALLLLKIVDPHQETPVLEAFSYKQLLHEPILGGGLFTTMCITLSHSLGPWITASIAFSGALFWLIMYVVYFFPRWDRFVNEGLGPRNQGGINGEACPAAYSPVP